MTNYPYDIAIIGAGAAGLTAAIFAAEEAVRLDLSLRICLIDGSAKPGAKILVSGGGRCNVTNEAVAPEDFSGGSQKIIRNVLLSFDEKRTVEWMESIGVPLKLEPTGKYFPESDSARTVLNALLARAQTLGVETRFGFRVRELSRNEEEPGWVISNAGDEDDLTATKVIVATGGRALPKSGSDGAGYPWLERLGHTIVPTVPALAPLVLDENGFADSPLSKYFAELSGVTLEAQLEFVVDGRRVASFIGSTLFTHFGLSGPAPMNMSRHIARHRQANPDADQGHLLISLGVPQEAGWSTQQYFAWADEWLLKQIRMHPTASLVNILRALCPMQMADCVSSAVRAERMSDVTRPERLLLAKLISGSPLRVKEDRGYSFAEATAGGVALGEVNWKTMQSRKADDLYLCGEVLDVDGRIGGFNFQWAWASGFLAGRAATGGVKGDKVIA